MQLLLRFVVVPRMSLTGVLTEHFFFCPLKICMVLSQMGMLSITVTLVAEERRKREAADTCS